MKKLSISLALVFGFTLGSAQNQFTNSGNFAVFSGASVSFFGNFANNGTITDAGAITFSGSASQVITGSSPTTFNNLVVNNTAGVTLQQDLAIANSLVLTSGQLNLNQTTITLNNTSSAALSRTAGYILSEQVNNSSKIKWNIGSGTGPHVFPFGTSAGTYIPFTLEVTAGDIGNVTVSTYPTASDNTPYPTVPDQVTNVNRFGSDNSANVVDRFWQIDKDGVSGTATLSFTAAPGEVGTISALQAQRWNTASDTWDDPIAGQSSSANGVTVYGVTEFSPWTLSGNSAPLPIEMLSFTAIPINNEVALNWKTASEINNDYFTIQRSKDGLEFSDISKVNAGTSGQTIQQYEYYDTNALPGKSYYRLRQTDLDGAYKFSEVKMVRLEESGGGLTAFPNPVTNGELSLDFQYAVDSPTSVVVYNMLGKIIFKNTIERGVRIYTLDLGSSPTGVYVVKTFNSQASFQQTVVLK